MQAIEQLGFGARAYGPARGQENNVSHETLSPLTEKKEADGHHRF
jgi:hypothetical protein